MLLSGTLSFAGEPVEGFRDLKFGMTKKEVAELESCSSSAECMFELSNKNRYIVLSYGSPEGTPGSSQTPPQEEGLKKISIDMGQFTDDWYQQLQLILGNSYELTHDVTEQTIKNFRENQQSKLSAGYEQGQVILTVERRKFGNLILKVIYQDKQLAKAFINQISSP